ncbi:O-antigen translocase [Domibacillus sp. A3M-37]|uniref:O-antigen translocase n=1 Tax=Domibacillus sp. A3M-37 TaxID=2962037 RepID=UPI0020B7EBFA|nr:O-antigen translocase [Domibacillus sp. A3M-37]MCP3761381.1 O-antigen translocase [Domibacillus sp. A3M-37]
MNLLKTSFLSGIATIIRMLTSLIVNKVIAVYIGPSGIAIIGNFQNILNILINTGTGGINSGVTKYIAEFNDNNKKRNEYLKASLIITITCSLITGILIVLFKEWLSIKAFKSIDYKSIFVLLGITIIFISLNSYLLALLNGLKQIKIYIASNIVASILSLIMTTIMTITLGLYGVLLSLVLTQSVVLIITTVYLFKKKTISNFRIIINSLIPKTVYTQLFKFSLMSFTTMLCIPIVQLVIRNIIISEVSLDSAGYWEALNKISNMYLLVITTALTTYYLPRLSEIKNAEDLRTEIKKSYKLILPLVGIIIIFVYILRDTIIHVLFTDEFLGMSDLFLFQLIGDFFKMSSWVLGYLMIAKAMTKLFIITELISGATYLILAYILIDFFGIVGVTLAYCLMYMIYMLIMIKVYFKIINSMKSTL